MLQRLSITNYLLIEQLELNLNKGLTILTGETGSGKSILLGALALAMGDRAEVGLARDPRKRCIIEIETAALSKALEPWFAAQEIPFEKTCIIRRVLEPNGRSRGFINDMPVKLEVMRELGALMVHIHSQHHTILLRDRAFMLGLLDMLAGNAPQVKEYSSTYRQWRDADAELKHLVEEEERSRNEREFLQFQLNELEEAKLEPNEFQQLENEVNRSEHAEEFAQVLSDVTELLDGDNGALQALQLAKNLLTKQGGSDAQMQQLAERTKSVLLEVKDIAEEAAQMNDDVEVDPAKAELLRERLDQLQHLLHKHRMDDVPSLIMLRDELAIKVEQGGSLKDRIEVKRGEAGKLQATCIKAAKEISAARIKVMKPLEKDLAADLKELGMPHGRVELEHSTVELGQNGTDSIRTLFTANKDRDPAPLEKAASGGELSRVMLALISRAAESMQLPTVIFDEIDTGVSGNVAEKVGELMRRMAKERQLIAITHLPQIASKADQHLLVSKEELTKGVVTSITPLDKEQRILTIAQMLSGKKTSKAAIENAKVLLGGE